MEGRVEEDEKNEVDHPLMIIDGIPDAMFHRVASRENVFQVGRLFGVMAAELPATATTGQVMAFLAICREAVSGRKISGAELRRMTEEVAGVDLIGPSVSRTVAALAQTGLIQVIASEDDRRSNHISLTRQGYAVLDRAMNMIS